jgi:hypothetical protein
MWMLDCSGHRAEKKWDREVYLYMVAVYLKLVFRKTYLMELRCTFAKAVYTYRIPDSACLLEALFTYQRDSCGVSSGA